MSKISLTGTLQIEVVDTDSGEAVRTSFLPVMGSGISFACWVKRSELSDDIEKRMRGEMNSRGGCCMIGLTSFSTAVVTVLRKDKPVIRNTFGM